MRSLLPQYFVRTTATCSRLMASAVFASAVSLLSWNQRAPGPPWWPAEPTNRMLRRRWACGTFAKCSSSPIITARPDPLSSAAWK